MKKRVVWMLISMMLTGYDVLLLYDVPTLSKECQRQHQPVQRQRSGICDVDDQGHGSHHSKEQVHGGVLPVH